jgi:uncharacterized protein (DUF1697 family)
MTQWIALLRGINVGGNNVLPMKDLRDLLEALGYLNVKTYIQSGNCVFDAPAARPDSISASISGAIEKQFGFTPRVFTLTREALEQAVQDNPYGEAEDQPKTVHFFFLETPAKADTQTALMALASDTEAFTLTDTVLYLHAPNGIGRSKLAAGAEKKLGVPATARNYNTVRKLIALAD